MYLFSFVLFVSFFFRFRQKNKIYWWNINSISSSFIFNLWVSRKENRSHIFMSVAPSYIGNISNMHNTLPGRSVWDENVIVLQRKHDSTPETSWQVITILFLLILIIFGTIFGTLIALLIIGKEIFCFLKNDFRFFFLQADWNNEWIRQRWSLTVVQVQAQQVQSVRQQLSQQQVHWLHYHRNVRVILWSLMVLVMHHNHRLPIVMILCLLLLNGFDSQVQPEQC